MSCSAALVDIFIITANAGLFCVNPRQTHIPINVPISLNVYKSEVENRTRHIYLVTFESFLKQKKKAQWPAVLGNYWALPLFQPTRCLTERL